MAVGAVRAVQPGRGGRAGRVVRHHPLPGGVLPDVAGVRGLSPAPLVQTLHHLPSPPEVALWSRYPEAPFVAISDEQARALAGLNVVGTVHHAVDTDAFLFGEAPDDYLLFLGRFTEGKGVLRRSRWRDAPGMRLMLAAAENDYYREHVAPLVDGARSSTSARCRTPRRWRCSAARARCSTRCRPAKPFGLVLAEAMACGTPVAALRSRRRPRDRRRRCDRRACSIRSTTLVAGLPRVLALDRARPGARGDALRRGPDGRGYLAVYRGADRRTRPAAEDGVTAPPAGYSLLAVFAHPDDESLACGGLLAWCADAGSARRCCASAAGGSAPGRRPTGCTWGSRAPASSRRRPASWARRRDAARLPNGFLPWVERAELEADILRAIIRAAGRRRHHLRRGRPLLASRSHRPARADDGGGAQRWVRTAPALYLRDDAAGQHAGRLERRGRWQGARRDWHRRPARRPGHRGRCVRAVRRATDADARRQRVRRPQAGRAALPSLADGRRRARSAAATRPRRACLASSTIGAPMSAPGARRSSSRMGALGEDADARAPARPAALPVLRRAASSSSRTRALSAPTAASNRA